MDIHYHGIWRMDWGLGNPNITGSLIALLMLAVWFLPLWKRRLFWVALPLFTGLGICLMHTMSRGGFVAAVAGFAFLLCWLPRPWPTNRILAISVALIIMLGGAVALQTTSRFGQSWQDRSITNRLEIWKYTPRMMVDAPAGWGLGKAANVFQSWYQPLDRHERYANLVSTHLTWLVEIGWPLRYLYLFGWSLAILICFPRRRGDVGFAIACALWLAFFVACIFSMVANVCWLWIAPALGLAAVAMIRIRSRIFPEKLHLLLASAMPLFILAGIYIYGINTAGLKIAASKNGTVRVGAREPKIWILIDPMATKTTVSETYPRNFREYLQSHSNAPCIGIANSAKALPSLTGCRLAIVGPRPVGQWHALHLATEQADKLLFISPDVPPAELNLGPEILAKSSVVFGEFTQICSAASWDHAAKLTRMEGIGDFFQNWPQIVFASLTP